VIKHLAIIICLGITLLMQQANASVPYKPQLADPVLEAWRWTSFPEYDTIRISCMAKDENGGMWMGIGNKAVFYNGYRTIQYIPDSTTIHSLIFEKNNDLLAATDKGIFRYKEGEFRKILDFNFNSQRNFATDQIGNIWIGSDYGLIKITPKSIFCLNPEGYFEIAANGSVLHVVRLEKANDYHTNTVMEFHYPVYNICISPANRIWMTVNIGDKNIATTGLDESQHYSTVWQFLKAPDLPVFDISGICETQNSVWVTSSNPNIMLLQYQIQEAKWKSINLKAIGGDNVQTSVLNSDDGTLWIGGHSKIYSLNASGWKTYQYPEVILPLAYNRIYLDKQENLFVFGENGSLMKLDLSGKRFQTYLGLNFNCNSPDGKYWFTTNAGEVVACDRLMQRFEKHTPNDGLMDMVMTLHYSAKSGLWAAGSHRGKAAVARLQKDRWNLFTFPDLYLGFAYNGICESGDSVLLFPVSGILEMNNTKYSGGFLEYNLKSSSWKNFAKDIVPQRIPTVKQTSDGRLWFSGGQVYVFDGKTTRVQELPGQSANWIDDVGISATDQIWVAQGGTGLFRFDGKTWTRFTTFNGLASNMVTNLLVESDSSVYVASDKGISYFDGKQFIPQIIHPELNIQRERGYLRKSNDGALWINVATREWYLYDFKSAAEDPTVFRTTMYRKENHPPKTKIAFSNQEISPSGNVIISFDGTDYWKQTPSDKLQFSYRLNQKSWSPFSVDKSCVFLDLDPGNYTFEVRSRDSDNNIETKPAAISFSVLPPVYRRAWFILTILTFVGIIVWLQLRLFARNRQIHELDQLKLRLFTDISHELKTPLTLISLPLQKLLDKSKSKSENKEGLELIYTNVQRLNNLVNQVVDFRRLEAGKIQLEVSPGDLVQHLRNISSYYKPLIHEKNIRFEFTCNLQELWVKYDADKLEKIVVNLLSNAFKYTPENEKVELIAKFDLPSERLQLWVNDSGPGIPLGMQQHIFDRFFRLKSDKPTRIPGSGIGLSLVKELVKLHRGTIEVISDGIHGSSFYVTLPVEPTEKSEESAKPATENVDLSKLNPVENASILFIEDEEPMLRFVSSELQKYFKVKGVGSVEKAYEWLNTEMPDLIISDVMLPGMTGTDFCRKLKSENLTSHLPVILLTARDSEEDIVEGLGTGADDYMTKPFKMNELIARCYNLIENRRRLKDRFADQEEIRPDTFTGNTADHQFLEKAISLVFENLDNPEFDVPQFCSGMNTSKTLLYSKLKSLTGQSATEFVRNIRLKEARKLLINNGHQYTIAEISYQVGFNDPLYFSRCFRKYFGIPPSEVGK
jgi:signal transduction histidine kinase/DNA-binding response OmpR family regulator/ligand-binding sensor domain-containing protein